MPETFGQLSQLQSLYLRSNQLSDLPETFGQLSQLQSLYLSSNLLSALPETFGQLSQLQSLDLNSNQLSDLPETFGHLSQLQTLYLSSNLLSDLPETFGQLSQLQSLYLSYNQLSDLPESVKSLINLKELNLEDNPILDAKLDRIRSLLPNCTIFPKRPEEIFAEKQAEAKREVESYALELAIYERNLSNGQAVDSSKMANICNSLGWNSLLSGQFEKAEVAIRRGLEIDSTDSYLYSNLPPALLFQGEIEKASELYKTYKDMAHNYSSMKNTYLDDFNTFEEYGIIPERLKETVEEIKAMLKE